MLTDTALLPTITPLIDQYEQGPVLTSSVPCLVCLSVYLCKTQQQLNALFDFQKIYVYIKLVYKNVMVVSKAVLFGDLLHTKKERCTDLSSTIKKHQTS